jgi:hypothetical protein
MIPLRMHKTLYIVIGNFDHKNGHGLKVWLGKSGLQK